MRFEIHHYIHRRGHRRRAGRFFFSISPAAPKGPPTRRSPVLELNCNDEQQIHVRYDHPTTEKGRPASYDGTPTIEVVTGEGTFTLDPDNLGCTLVSGDGPGDTEYMLRADAKLGEGVEEISEIIRLRVSGANASSFGIVASAPTAKP